MKKIREYPLWVQEVLGKERSKRKLPLEVKEINPGCFYLYHSTTKWNKKEKKVKRVSKYLGKITPKNFIEKGKVRKHISVYEYGAVKLLNNLIEEYLDEPLQKYFYEYHNELKAISLMKILKDIPIKQMQDFWDKIFLSLEWKTYLSPSTISAIYQNIGRDLKSQYDYFNYFMKDKDYYAFDLSSIFSQSENINLAEKGYNKESMNLNQINFLMLYSISKNTPVMLKPILGSIKDISSLKHELSNIKANNLILILDRGFASYDLPKELKSHNFKYVIPLRRNFSIIDCSLKLNNSFYCNNRGIHWGTKITPYGKLYLFEDVALRSEEESNFIRGIEEGKKSKKEFNKEKEMFGKIAIISNVKTKGQKIYEMFKDRENIEVTFDSMKNQLEIDKTYLQSTESVRGYFFVIYNSLFLYYKILNLLKKNNLNKRISVSDVLMLLSKIYLVDFGHKKQITEIPKKVGKLIEDMELNIENIFPKILRS